MPYRTIDHLASGGMGELHVAHAIGELGIERLVVTKRLRLDLVEDERAALMFVDEARIAASLYHRNIVQVLDVIVETAEVVLVLEYVPGVNLAQLLDAMGGPLSYTAAITIVLELAAGLHYTHERTDDDGAPLEIVHRDVSLPNVLVSDHGHVKLTDFGIAKARSRLYVTRSSSIKGKLGYMAPEQIHGANVDRRADVFGLGVVLYEITCGVPMFTSGSDYETMRKIVDHEITSPGEVIAGYPPALEAVIRRAVAPSADARHGSAREFADEVRAVAAAQGWVGSRTELAALVTKYLPPGPSATPWRRAPVEQLAWVERTTRRPG